MQDEKLRTSNLLIRGDGVGSSGIPQEADTSGAVSRRVFLGYLSTAITAFIGIVTGVPILRYLAGPLSAKTEATWVTLGKVKDFGDPVPKVVQFTLSRRDGWVEIGEARTCWVAPKGDGTFAVFNGQCTHLGCAYSWQTQGPHADRFFCPCHDGVYDREGRVLDGPPPRPLDQLEAKVEGDELLVLYQDFRLGVPQKDPL